MTTKKKITAFITLFLLVGSAVFAAEKVITVDCLQSIGEIKPLHGINLGPLCYRGTIDLSKYHRELKIPYTRLHDVVYQSEDAVDISTIFRDFRNPADDPASYDFRITDDYLQAIINTGSKIIYRLGESIEHTPRKYRVNPPPDFEKWADVCVRIISHYNEGWANGFHHNIEYWEIWNEPDVKPAMWTGTDEQFFRLFEITAKKIKSAHPKVKVGGPALGNPVMNENSNPQPTPYLANFLSYCRQHNVPLDFFSWHCYTSEPQVIAAKARAVRQILDNYGFTKTESHFNEWNYLPRNDWSPMLGDNPYVKAKWYDEMGGPDGAVFLATVLILLHDLKVDVANFYTGIVHCFGLFDCYGAPKKVYFAMKAFSKMLDTPVRLKATGSPAEFYVLSGMNMAKNTINILVPAKIKTPETISFSVVNLPWKGKSKVGFYLVDKDKNLDLTDSKIIDTKPSDSNGNEPAQPLQFQFQVQSPSVLLITITPEDKK